MSRILYEGAQAERKVSVFDPACAYDFKLEKTKDESVLLKKKEVKAAIADGTEISCSVKLTNTDRTFGTLLGRRNHKTASGRTARGYHHDSL